MIENIKLHNFKSLVDVDIELKPLNVLIGRNGSGKSNFLSFFHLLREGAQERLNPAVNSMGGISNVISYGVGEFYRSFEWQVLFHTQYMRVPLYTGEIAAEGRSRYTITTENYSDEYSNVHKREPIYLSVSQGSIKQLEGPRGSPQTNHEDVKDHELAIAQIRDQNRYPRLAEIRSELADWQIYHGFGEESLTNMRSPQLFNVVDPLRLDPLGKNLLSVIQELANGRRYETIYERLLTSMRAVFPDFIKLYTPTSAGGMGSLFYGSQDHTESIPALNMSDGQLRFLGLVLILLLADLPNPPSLIVIDEPEIGMHPDMIAAFADLLKIAATKTQIIIATHSPQLIDAMRPEDIIVAEREEGKTTLRRLEAESLNRWLERYTLGKLWTMGKLEA